MDVVEAVIEVGGEEGTRDGNSEVGLVVYPREARRGQGLAVAVGGGRPVREGAEQVEAVLCAHVIGEPARQGGDRAVAVPDGQVAVRVVAGGDDAPAVPRHRADGR